MSTEPITHDWLRANGWHIDIGRNDPRLPVRRREIGRETRDWLDTNRRGFGTDPDDLCIDVAQVTTSEDEWFCWLMQVEPYRHIHIRHVQYTWELMELYEGLTGCAWRPGGAYTAGDAKDAEGHV